MCKKIRVAFICSTYESFSNPLDLLQQHFTTVDWANALKKEEVDISVLYRFHKNTSIEHQGITYHFYKDKLPPLLKSYHFPFSFYHEVARFINNNGIHIIHAHHPGLIMPNILLSSIIKIPILMQIHYTPQKIHLSSFKKLGLQKVKKVLFASKDLEKIWLDHNILSPEQCSFVMEYASPFRFKNREIARAATDLKGDPVWLSIGNLNKNKDPITILKAFQLFLKHHPKAKLHLIFKENEMGDKIPNFIKQYPALISQVVLLGKIDRAKIDLYYNSADYIISASHREGSGYAILEAISCGVIPILSSIPSFKDITHQGSIGQLFETGNHLDLYHKMLKINQEDIAKEQQKVLTHYQNYFSFPKLAKVVKQIYQEILDKN